MASALPARVPVTIGLALLAALVFGVLGWVIVRPALSIAMKNPAPFESANVRARAVALARIGKDSGSVRLRSRRALARYLTDRKLWAPALYEWNALLAEWPKDADARFTTGVVLDALGRTADAIDAYRAAVAVNANAAAFRLRLAERLWQTEQFGAGRRRRSGRRHRRA